MTLFAYLHGDDEAHHVRLGGIGLTTNADGTVGFGGIVFDDPDGDLEVRGWMEVTVVEDACADAPILFRGWIGDRTYTRTGPEGTYRSGAGRWIDCNLVDGNGALAVRLIVNPDGKRGAETDVQRIHWILGSGAGGLDGLVADLGLIDDDTPRPFEDSDYRDQYALDVLTDVAGPLGRIFFVYVDALTGDFGLFYDFPTSSTGPSPLSISNDQADSTDTCHYPLIDAQLHRDPSAVVSLNRFRYRNGVVLEGDTDTYDEFFSAAATGGADLLNRGSANNNERVGSEDTARIMSQGILAKGSTEEDTITVSIQVPPEQVGLVAAGQLIDFKATHLDLEGYGDFVAMRVKARNIQQLMANDLYLVTLELNNSGIVSNGGGGGPGPGDFPQPPAGPPTIVQMKCGVLGIDGPTGGLTMDLPPTEGSWLVGTISSRGTGITLASGWTEHPHGGVTAGSDFGRMVYREVGPGESADIALATVGGGHSHVWEVSGIDGTLDTSSFAASGFTTTQPASINAGTLTPTSGVPAILLMMLVQHNSDWTGNGPTTMSTPAGWTTDCEYEVTNNGDLHPNFQANSQIPNPTTGSYGTTSTIAGAGFNYAGWAGLALAFAGSAAANPPTPAQDTGWIVPTFVTDGEPYTWQMPFPFADGSLEIRLDGNAQTWTSYDGVCGQFTVPFVVLPGERFEARAIGR